MSAKSKIYAYGEHIFYVKEERNIIIENWSACLCREDDREYSPLIELTGMNYSPLSNTWSEYPLTIHADDIVAVEKYE